MKRTFTPALLRWHAESNKRIMPWKGEKDPYKIWLSEIILQQTRVEQGLKYYEAFILRYPTVLKLAAAKDEEVYKLWEGLGYYTRCKNLLITARTISTQFEGKFPCTYEEILKLKGIGPYTAAAIASFAFDLPHAVLDGNVFRVLSRYFGVGIPIDNSEGKRFFTELAQNLLDKMKPGKYNQAIMDFGATICKPKIPECRQCVLQPGCYAFKNAVVNKLPLKEKVLQRRERWFYYFIFKLEDRFLINKRPGGDIWENLHEFFLYESVEPEKMTKQKLSRLLKHQLGIESFTLNGMSSEFKQVLTHQLIHAQFLNIELFEMPAALSHMQTYDEKKIKTLSFPKIINEYFSLVVAGKAQ